MFKKNFLLAIFAVYQFFTILGIVIGSLPSEIIYLNLVLQLAAIVFFDLEYALLSVIISMPFYVALPIKQHDSFQIWKIAALVLFATYLFKEKVVSLYPFKIDWNKFKFFKWDRNFLILGLIAAATVLFSSAPFLGVKKVLFVINIYFFYLVAIHVWDNKEKIYRATSALFASIAVIMGIGFLQFFSTFLTSINYFWSYWATFISKLYFGSELYSTLLYSNSWFSPSPGGGEPSLRMFSILPDSHSFAVITLFSLPLALGLSQGTNKKWQKVLFWIYIAFADLAIVMSGTKGVWVGMLAVLLIAAWLFFTKYGRKIIKPSLAALAIFVVMFGVSPLLQKAVAQIRAGSNFGNYLDRAENIYNLEEYSNATRLVIWKKVLVYSFMHPITGAGFGNFQDFLNGQKNLSTILNLPDRYITAHNLYLGIFAEIGIFGLIAFIWWFKKIAEEYWSFFKKHYLFFEDPFVVMLIAQGLIFAALAFYCLVDETLFNDRVLIFFFLQLALSASIIRQYE